MKSVFASLVFLLLGASLPAVAQLLPQETDLCQYGGCTQRMAEIQGAYSATTEFDPLATEIGFYSGSCYHLMGGVGADQEHYGGFVLWRNEEQNGEMNFLGVFTFFAALNPYANMTPQQGWERIQSRSSRPKVVREETTQGHVLIESETANIHYWMRTAVDGNEMYLLSLWDFKSGPKNRSFCRLQRH